MQYLVTMDNEAGPVWPPEDREDFAQRIIRPGFDVIERLKNEGKIVAGGLQVGRKTITFIAEAESNDALDEILHTIPWFWTTDTDVIPLSSWGTRR